MTVSDSRSIGGQAGKAPLAARLVVHTVVLLVSIVPALSFIPVYPIAAPVLLPAQWLGAGIGGWSIRFVYGLFAAFVAWQTLVFAVWGFTRCGGHAAVWYAALPAALLLGVVLVLSSAQGVHRRAFARYAMFVIPILLVTVISLFFYSPGSNEFLSPGCPRP